MVRRITEIRRNHHFRQSPVTEIHRSPFRGREVFGAVNRLGLYRAWLLKIAGAIACISIYF